MFRNALIAAMVAAFAVPAVGAEKEHRQHGVHEHGTAELNLVWEGKIVTIELESPSMNIVGFEHAPRTETQKRAVQQAETTLKDASSLFSFTPEAGCRGQTTEVKSELIDAKNGAGGKGKGAEHSEFEARYRFTCDNPDALKTVDVGLFKRFPKMHKLRAQSVSARGQAATELRPGNARLSLR
jgi:hypothetical protein